MKRKYLFWIRAWGNFQKDNCLMAKQVSQLWVLLMCYVFLFIVRDLKGTPCFKSTVFTSEVKSIHQHWTWVCLPLLPTFLACSCGNSAVNWWSIFCSQFLNATFYRDVVLLTGVPISTKVLFFPSCLFIHCYFCFTFVSLSQTAIKDF